MQFFLTLGTVLFGAFVAVKVFGMDIVPSEGGRRKQGTRRRSGSGQRQKRQESVDVTGGVMRVLSSLSSSSPNDGWSDDGTDGLLDVSFSRAKKGKKNGGGGGGGSSGMGDASARRRRPFL